MKAARGHLRQAVCVTALVALALSRPLGTPSFAVRRAAPEDTVTSLAVEAGRNLNASWQVKSAQSEEDFGAVRLTVTIKNISELAVPAAYFFGRYYDASGRLCFVALFSLGNNLKGRKGPAKPGEVRTLLSVSLVSSATAPRLLTLSSAHRVVVPGRSRVPPALAAPSTPAVIAPGSVSSGDEWRRLCLGGHPSVPDRPVVDVGLGRGIVDPQGRLRNFQVLDALATRPYVAWLEELASHLMFVPASRSGRPVASTVLILASALVRARRAGEPLLLPRFNPWVRRAARNVVGPVPPVEVVRLYPPLPGMPSAASSPQAPPCFGYWGEGTAWSVDFPYLVPPSPAGSPRGRHGHARAD